jgi:hypothetical protein
VQRAADLLDRVELVMACESQHAIEHDPRQ